MRRAAAAWTAFAAALLAAILTVQVRTAGAHASMIGSEPPDRAVVAAAPDTVVMTFNEPVAPLTVRLVAPGGATHELDGVTSENQKLHVRMPAGLGRGTHVLSWRVVSADGHPVGGSLIFSIGEPTLDPSEFADLKRQRNARTRQAALWLCKLVLYLGLMFGCGGAFYAAFIGREPLAGAPRRIAAAGIASAAVAVFLSAGLQGSDAYDTPLADLRDTGLWLKGLATPYGPTAVLALAALALAGVSLNARPARARVAAGAALMLTGAALAASGHASSAAPQIVTRPMVFIHGIAAAFWIGSLPPLCAALGRSAGASGATAVARFSRVVPLSVAALVLSGALLALIQLRTFEGLWATAYGWILCCKLALVTALLALGFFNRYVLTPAVSGGNAAASRRMARSIAVEIAIAVLILALVAAWRFTPPPRSLQAAAAAPVHAHIHAGKAMADIRIERQPDGLLLLLLTLLDGQFGPMDAKEVVLVLSKPDAGIERARYAARRVEATIWRIQNLSLPIGGRWTARVEILIDDFEKVAIEGEIELSR